MFDSEVPRITTEVTRNRAGPWLVFVVPIPSKMPRNSTLTMLETFFSVLVCFTLAQTMWKYSTGNGHNASYSLHPTLEVYRPFF